MTDCSCILPPDCWPSGPWHCRRRESGSVEAYERCPAAVAEWRTMRLTLEAAGVPVIYRDYNRESFRDWPEVADEWLADPGMLYVHGPNGTGKTHLSVALLGEMLKRGQRGCYVSAKLIPELDSDRHEGDKATIERYRAVPVLVLDDLFSEATFKAEKVRNLLEVRWRDGLATICTSMKGPGAAVALDSDLASRAMSGRIIERKGIDRRIFPS